MTDFAIHTDQAERPDWQLEQKPQRTVSRIEPHPIGAAFGYVRVRFVPVYRVKAVSRPHPWPQSKFQSADFLTKRFTEVK